MESLLHWADYLVLVGFLIISLAIGIYHSLTGGRQKTTTEFIMGDRRLKVIPTAISLLVSFYSAITMLGLTVEMYIYGAQFMVFTIVTPAISVFLVERFIVPWLYPMKLVSIFDFLEMRFMSKTIRIFGATLGIITGLIFMGAAMYAPSAALESATGLSLTVSMPLMAVVSVAYTALGGMRAVIWTDVFQFVTMMVGIIAIFVKGLMLVGGITNVFRLAGEEGRLELANFSFDPRERHTVWSLGIGMGISCIVGYGVTQTAVQRFSAVDKLSKARATILLNIPPMLVMNALSCIIGLVILAHYANIKCDPLANKEITNPNMLLSYFVVTIFTDAPGFSGLFLATLYGGALSTMSSMLSGTAANCWEDILKYKLNHLPESRKALINRILVVLFGVLSIGVAFLCASVTGPITQVLMAMSSAAFGPMAALFVLGAVSKHANWKGSLIGGVVGVVITFWLGIGSMTVRNLHPPLPPVSVEQCSLGNSSFPSSLNNTKYTSFEIVEGFYANENWNETTTEVLPVSRHQGMSHLRGLENFYAMSYLWIGPFAIFVTSVIGIIASLIMRDKDQEAKVDKRLLIRFYGCGWNDEYEKADNDLDDKKIASIQETEALNGSDDEILKDVEMTSLKKTENGFSKHDLKNETEYGLLKNEDP